MMKMVNYIDKFMCNFKIQSSKFKIQSLEFMELQIVIIKIANIALQNSYIHNMMELYIKY